MFEIKTNRQAKPRLTVISERWDIIWAPESSHGCSKRSLRVLSYVSQENSPSCLFFTQVKVLPSTAKRGQARGLTRSKAVLVNLQVFFLPNIIAATILTRTVSIFIPRPPCLLIMSQGHSSWPETSKDIAGPKAALRSMPMVPKLLSCL